mgnify:CR=1 FL=1
MMYTNDELLRFDYALRSLMTTDIRGGVKFKFYKLSTVLEEALKPIVQSLNETYDLDERKDILEKTQDLILPTFEAIELEDIEMSLEQMHLLSPLIKGVEEYE